MDLVEAWPFREICGIPRLGKLVLAFENAGSLEPRVDLLQAPEAADQQRRTDDEHDGERRLRNDQRGPQTPAFFPVGTAISAFLEVALQIEPECLQERHEPEHCSGQQRDGQHDWRGRGDPPRRRRSWARQPALARRDREAPARQPRRRALPPSMRAASPPR